MKVRKIFYYFIWAWGLGGSAGIATAQTTTGLEEKLVLRGDNDFLICNDEGKQFRTYVYNETSLSDFQDGTFELDLGNGSAPLTGLAKSDFPKVITYTESKEYTLLFSALTKAGQKVTRAYQVKALSRPAVSLDKANLDVQCIGNEIVYLVNVMDKNSSGTVYMLDYDDATPPDKMTNEELKAAGGKFRHIYRHSYCDKDHMGSSRQEFEVKLTVSNECNYSDFKIISEHVVTPISAKFTFDKRKNCTYEPVKLRNLTTGGGNSDCSAGNIFWEWDFGNGRTSNAFEPEITYEEARNYNITLRATNNYACAGDTATIPVVLIDRVKADFKMMSDTLCVGETLKFYNASSGEDLHPYRWAMVSEEGFPQPEYREGTNFTSADPVVRFNHYGRYKISLFVSNDCSESQKDTVIVVKQDPGIFKFDLPAEICPSRLDFPQYVRIDWNGNAVEPVWTIQREGGQSGDYTFAAGTGPSSAYPQIDFQAPGVYNIRLKLKTSGCGGTVLEKSVPLKVYDPVIVKKVETGTLQICEGGQVAFTSRSSGENLTHKWTVTPSANTVFDAGTNSAAANPVITFKKYGDYTVHLKLSTLCSEQDTSFEVHVRKEPNISHFEPQAAVCPNDVIDFHDCIIYQFWNNPEKAEWTISPLEGLEFLEGTDVHSVYPKIRFLRPGTYRFKVKLESVSCGQEGVTQELERTVKVRNSTMTMSLKADELEVCEEGRLEFSMKAEAAEDDPILYSWRVNPLSATGSYAFEEYGNQKSLSEIRFHTWGSYEVRAEASSYCGVLDSTVTVRVKKDPEVRLKDTTGWCPGIVDWTDYVSYEWYNNTPAVSWEILPAGSNTPADGFEYVEATNAQSLYPKTDFKKKGEYQVRVSLSPAGCKEEFLTDLKLYPVYDTTILMDVNPLGNTDICEGELVRFRNMSEGVGLSYQWQVEGLTDGWAFAEATGADSREPVFLFTRYGEYKVKVKLLGTCNQKEKSFSIKVRGVPEVNLKERLDAVCASPATVDLGEYTEYKDLKNCDVSRYWTITPDRGWEFEAGSSSQSETPRIRFSDPAAYTITLMLYSQCVENGVSTRTAQLNVLNSKLKAVFSVDSTVCVPAEVVLENRSEGDSLSYTWEITSGTASGGGWEWTANKEEENPGFRLSEEGFYDIALSVKNICGEDDSVFRVKAFGIPEVQLEDISGVCEPYLFTMPAEAVIPHNDAVTRAEWSIVSTALYDEFDPAGLYPEIGFHAGSFQVEVKYWNRCPEPGRQTFTVEVDEFIPVAPMANDTLCHLEPALQLKAQPEGGIWELAGADDLVRKEGEDWWFDPLQAGDYELLYSYTHKSCTATNTLKVKVHALPVVEAGENAGMCLNDAPRTLAGTPEGGWWEGEGMQADVYTPQAAGESWLKYYYRDGHHCVNRDSLLLTVHPLPGTDFQIQPQYCLREEAEFVPQTAEKEYIWKYGDGTADDTLTTSCRHVYTQPGFYDVQLVSVSVYGCQDTSELQKIEIVNDAPPALFELDKHAGCGPEVEVNITLKEADYADPNLRFEWDFGNGNRSESLLPQNPQRYTSALWDTTYRMKFKVYNICNGTEMSDSVVVGSHPQVDFTFRHRWNCSPVNVEFQNLSTGNKNKFTWYMGDGEVFEEVYEPAEHLYTAEGKTKVYEVALVGENQCGKDSIMKPLTILPRTLDAFFEMPKENICVGEEICFTNRTTDTSLYVNYKYWDFGDEVRDTAWHACHSYREAGTYQVLLYVDNGCGFDTIRDQLRVWALPQVEIRSEEERCDQDTFHISLVSDQQLQWIQWDLGDGVTAPEPAFEYVYEEAGKYQLMLEVIAENIALCKARYLKPLEVHPLPDLEIRPLDTLVCPPWLFQPQVSGEASLLWDYGDGSGLTTSMEHWYENPTDSVLTRQVVLQATSDKGCRKDFTGFIEVSNLPVARMQLEVSPGHPQKVDLLNLSRDYTDCIWYLPSGRVEHTFEDRQLEFMENGWQVFSLVARNQYGCQDSTAVEYEVLIKGLYFPNTFIPHSLNGKVSRFNGIGMGLERYKLEVFDKYGNKIWETQALTDGKPSEGWDGCNSQGKPMPQDVYIWRAEAIFKDAEVWSGKNNASGVPQTTQGSVFLLRE